MPSTTTADGYESFKKKVVVQLKRYKYGLTWSEIKRKARLKQTVPYNGWVNRMEKEAGLKRVKDARGILWVIKK